MLFLAIILLIVGVVALIAAFTLKVTDYRDNPLKWPNIVAGAIGVLALLSIGFTSMYTQEIGQARVIINAGGTISHVDNSPGFGWKAPWQKVVDFDLISQSLEYAGNDEGAPSYTNGDVQGQEVTSYVKGGAQVTFNASVTYDLVGSDYAQLYTDFRSQERFTQQRIARTVRDALRDTPSAYSPSDFRGEKQGEATDAMQSKMNEDLAEFGVEVTTVVIDDIRFNDQVEESIRNVEVAQQKEAQAQAELRASEVSAQQQVVSAQAEADAAIAKAQGEAEANRLIAESLTPQVLQQRYIEALDAGTVFVVPEGSTPMVNTAPAAQ